MLTMRQKKAVTRELRDRYQRSSKKEKIIILNGFVQLTGYNRCYACQVLNMKKEKVLGYVNISGKRIKYVADKGKIKRKKKKIYDQDVLVALIINLFLLPFGFSLTRYIFYSFTGYI